jgi:hypothetical protein
VKQTLISIAKQSLVTNVRTHFLNYHIIGNNIQFEETSFHSLIKSETSFII